MSEENLEVVRRPNRSLSLLLAALWIRRLAAVLAAFALTWWVAGDDSWFKDPLPERAIVLLSAVLLGVAVLVFTGILKFSSSRLPARERAQLRDRMLHPIEAAGPSE